MNETMKILMIFEGRNKNSHLNPYRTLIDCKSTVISKFNLMTEPQNINLYIRIQKPPKPCGKHKGS
jgi:hypothetical protein